MRFFHGRQLQPREFVNLGDERRRHRDEGRVLSVYPATEGLSFKLIRSIIDAHLDALLPLVQEYLPADVLERGGRARASPRRCAWCIARRRSPRRCAAATRLAFEELFFVQLLQLRAKELAREQARRHSLREQARADDRSCASRCRSRSPARRCARLREIFADMTSERRMQRLLQGDVGSGKTIVALFAALLAIENGYQAAIMAPTELLAEQHARTMTTHARAARHRSRCCSPAACRRKNAQRDRARVSRADEPVLVVGTHALVQESTQFARLGFAAIDEQHRFGVEQRKALARKGRGARRAADVRDADPALAGAHALRRSRSQHARRASARPAADHDRAAPRVGARARACSSSTDRWSRDGRRTSSIR